MSRRFLFLGKKIVIVQNNTDFPQILAGCRIKPTNTYAQAPGPILLPKNESVFASGTFQQLIEAGFGVVIGKTCANVSKENASNLIAGYFTAVNLDINNQIDYFDTACPVSEFIPKSSIHIPERMESWFSINNGRKKYMDLKNFNAYHLFIP